MCRLMKLSPTNVVVGRVPARRLLELIVYTGRMIDLTAILAQHQRTERAANRKIQPAIRVTGFDDVDQEAAALCEAIDGTNALPEPSACSRVSSYTRRLDW